MEYEELVDLIWGLGKLEFQDVVEGSQSYTTLLQTSYLQFICVGSWGCSTEQPHHGEMLDISRLYSIQYVYDVA